MIDLTRLDEYAARAPEARISGRLYEGTPVTVRFAEFLEQVGGLRRVLSEGGLHAGQAVGLHSPNCYEWLVWDAAVSLSGGLLIAFPEGTGLEEHESLRERYALSLLVVGDELAHSAGSEYVRGISDIAPPGPIPVDGRLAADDDSECHARVFSSGTSGYLKGLRISRTGTERLIQEFIEAFEIDASDRFVIFLPLSNYQQRMLFYLCLYLGMDFTVSVVDRVFAELRRFAPSFLLAPPSLYDAARRMGSSGQGMSITDLLGGNIRFLVTGMAPTSESTLRFFWENGLPLYEVYGVVECGMISWNTRKHTKLGTVGRLVQEGSVTIGEDGEILVTRRQPLTMGYFECREGDEERTFRGGKTVATGDVGYFDEDGYLVVSGRKKDVILTSGGRKLHPSEIEDLISTHSDVRDAVVFCDHEGSGISAVICVDDEARRTAIESFVDGLNASLPPYKQVRRTIFRGRLSTEDRTLTRNLKKDRSRIRALYGRADA